LDGYLSLALCHHKALALGSKYEASTWPNLLQVGFTVPSVLLRKRWAFTSPFHPYLCPKRTIGGLLSVALSLSLSQKGFAGHRLGGTLPHCSSDFPLRNAAAVCYAKWYYTSKSTESKQNWN